MQSFFQQVKFLPLLFALLFLTACASGSSGPTKGRAPTSSTGSYKIGQPYQINGNWYYPREDYSYDETGIASWYGTEFNGTPRTANGELFNKDELTAAHKTLPLPTLARVTNLENGKSVVVRINDRGPFSGARIIDVTHRVAQLLDFERQGTAKVRVQVLSDESKAIADAMRRYGTPAAVQMAADVRQQQMSQTQPFTGITPETLQPSPTEQIHGKIAPVSVYSVRPVPIVRQLEVSGSNQIYIQAGSFSNQENAKKMQQRLSSLGSARITETVVQGSKFYRVRLGPIKNVAQADALLKKTAQAGAAGAKVVVD